MDAPHTNPFRHYRENSEKVHKEMSNAHWSLLKARDSIAKAIREFQLMEENQDNRNLAETWGMKVKAIRDSIEAVMSSNSRISTDLIYVTGCDGSCRPQ